MIHVLDRDRRQRLQPNFEISLLDHTSSEDAILVLIDLQDAQRFNSLV